MSQRNTLLTNSYLAGFIDGDGSIYVRLKPNQTYRYGYQIAPSIILFQSAKEKDKFEKICALIGSGYIRERKDGILEYTINRQEAILELIHKIKPYLILKKNQAELMEKILFAKQLVKNKQDFSKVMELINSFGELNYSHKRVRRGLTP